MTESQSTVSSSNIEPNQQGGQQLVFDIFNNYPRPQLPIGLIADGVNVLTVDHCVARFGRTAEDWARDWHQMWDRYLGALDRGEKVTAAAIQSAVTNVAMDVVRTVRFPHLNDDQWTYVKEGCERRKIHPTEIWVKLRTNVETKKIEPVIITTIGVFRRIAEATGFRGGESPIEFCGPDCVWTPGPWPPGKGRPHAARCFITRKDLPNRFEGIAYFDQCAQYVRGEDGKPVLGEAWEKAESAPQLAKCSIVAGYRAAYTELSGLYTLEEMHPRRSSPPDDQRPKGNEVAEILDGSPVEKSRTSNPPVLSAGLLDDPKQAMTLVDETTPELERLPIELVYAGACASIPKAQELIDDGRLRWPRIYRWQDSRAFSAVVIEAARRKLQPAAA